MTNVRKALFLLIFLFSTALFGAKPPPLTPRDAASKIEEILRAHATYKELSRDLIQRCLENYINELDPLKTYLLDNEIVKWTKASPETIENFHNGYRSADYRLFEEIHEVMIEAIKRRGILEVKVNQATLPQGVQPAEFKNLEWAKSEDELLERLLKIRSLQVASAEKLSQETKQQFLQRMAKHRTSHEEEITGKTTSDRTPIILSYVLKATSSALDSQTAYFTPAEANQFMMQVQQRLFGIGAQLRDDLDGFTIVRLLEGGPAGAGDKLKVGDKIIAVDNEPVVGLDIVEAVEKIRGQEGTKVHLTVLRTTGEGEAKKEEKVAIDLVRGEVVLKETRLETLQQPYGDGVIGIFHLFSFYQDPNSSSTADLLAAIEKLKKEHNLKGVILDLRNNAGGHLTQAVSVTGLFIRNGVVVSVKDHTGEIQKLRNFDSKLAWDGPLIVLTNRASASASEIVAQTLQDYGRALVVGDPQTFGKGTFQIFSLEASHYGRVNPQGEYKVTRGRYYTVSGKSPQLVGVDADVFVPGALSELEVGEKFSKFPLENDMISPAFDDDLSDLSFLQKYQIQRTYRANQQTILDMYAPFLETIRKNSMQRIEANKNYQNFIKEFSKKDTSIDSTELFGQNDLQLDETINIMKDLVLLMQSTERAEQAVN